MSAAFPWRVAVRYFRSRRRIGSPFFSVAGIAAGVMTLTAVLGVMNGFQLSFITPILEVRSYHLQVRGLDRPSELRGFPEITAVTPFVDVQAIAAGTVPCVLRALSPDPADKGFRAAFDRSYDSPLVLDRSPPDSVVLGSQLAARLGVGPGDTVTFFAFAAGNSADVVPREVALKVVGLFKTGYYELDLNWAFTRLDTLSLITEGEARPVLGVKIRHPAREQEVARRIRERFGPKVMVAGWREMNRLFFTALKTEKAMMMLLIALVFVVVSVNIFHSLLRAVREREEELAMLRAIGASAASVRAVFVIEGLLIGATGALIGNALGLLVSYNVNEVFRGAELIANGLILPLVDAIVRPFAGGMPGPELSIFSPRVFYIDRVPAHVLPLEAMTGSGLAIACALLAAVAASRRVAEVRPQEVLRRV